MYARFTRPSALTFTNPDTRDTEANDLDAGCFYLTVASGEVNGVLEPQLYDQGFASSSPIDFAEGETGTTC